MPTLRRLREEAALTQTELARACGVSQHAVWRWEQALARPSPEHRRRLAQILGKSPKEVLEAVEATAEEAKERAAA
jgi:transcriptional regulator with XRE-family HTH domain